MQIYYTTATAELFNDDQKEESTLLSRIESFLEPKETAAFANSGQIELYHTEKHGNFDIFWVGVRRNDAARLIGAVVRDTKTQACYFFAVEFTATHDYQKTLVQNDQRRSNWRGYIVDFLTRLPTMAEPVTPTTPPQRLLEHQGRLRVADMVQAELIDIPIRLGVLCFGAPGAGKTLVAAERTRSYAEHGLKTATFAPTQLLADEMKKEIVTQGIDVEAAGTAFWSLDGFLAAMQPHYPHLKLVYDKQTDKQKNVNARQSSLITKNNRIIFDHIN